MVWRRVKDATALVQQRWKDAREAEPHDYRYVLKEFLGPELEKSINDSLIGTAIFALDEKARIYEPEYLMFNADPAPVLKHPTQYGLEGFGDIILKGPQNERYLAWYKEAEPGKPTVAYCHGVASQLDTQCELLKQMAGRGLGVMIVAYPGFKGSKADGSGKAQICSQAGCIRAADAMISALRHPEKFGLPIKPVEAKDICGFGASLGVSVLLHTLHYRQRGIKQPVNKNPLQAWAESGEKEGTLLGRAQHTLAESFHGTRSQKHTYKRDPEQIGAAICFGGFSSLGKVVHGRHPRLMDEWMENPFKSEDIIGGIRTPLLLMHGTDDTVVPPLHCAILTQRGREGGATISTMMLEGVNHWLAAPGTQSKDLKSTRMDPQQVSLLLDDIEVYMHNGYRFTPTDNIRDSRGDTNDRWRKMIYQQAQQPSAKGNGKHCA